MGKRAILTTWLTISIFLVALATGAAAAGRIIYVDDTATGANDGSSWSDGYNYLQDALADANSAEKPVEIRVAQGIYKPDLSGGNTLGEREATFQLINGVTLKGGYAGFGEPDPNTRNVDLYETVLSGDLHGNDRPNFANHWENSYHVVTSSSTNETAVLDGFTITGGCAVDFAVYGRPPSNLSILRGGGMYGILGSPTLTNCTFYANSASLEGGGMYNEHDSNPMLIDCSFHMNSVYWHGGGMYNKDNSNPNLTNCTFSGNWASYGGGMSNDHSSPTLDNCTFRANSVDWDGGGMYNSYSSPTLFNCIFIGNSGYNGGGMENFIRSSPALNDCTFSRNLADKNGGGMHSEYHTAPTLNNCIFSENSADENGGGMYNHEDSNAALTHCIFIENSCSNGGGGMWNSMSNPTLFNCTFSGNLADFGGGMVNGFESSPILTNCTFSGNSANDGGGMDNSSNSSPILTNCKFVGNSASWGGGMYNWNSSPTLSNCTFVGNRAGSRGGGIYQESGFGTLANCILWDNIRGDVSGLLRISYTDVPWGDVGQGNISTNPLFANPGYWDPNSTPDDPNDDFWVDGDYHLKSEAGRWDPNSESWVRDDVTSPCIDAGDPNSDWTGELWPHGERVNMGAYGGTAEASMSPYDANSIPDLAQASNPSPADETAVGLHIKLSWTAGLYAVSHDVYFGTSSSPPFVCNQTETEFDPGTLRPGTTYFWRIDEVDSESNRTTGKVWRFTTIPPKGKACFTGETRVWLGGALIPISKVSVGRNLGRADGAGAENSSLRLPSLGKVENVQEHDGTFVCYDVLLETGNCISVAECHYFLEEAGRWVALQNLKAGIRLQSPKGSIGIISVTKRPIPYVGKVYNLKVEGSDRYLVGEDAVTVRDY